jgi:hypothetical protein
MGAAGGERVSDCGCENSMPVPKTDDLDLYNFVSACKGMGKTIQQGFHKNLTVALEVDGLPQIAVQSIYEYTDVRKETYGSGLLPEDPRFDCLGLCYIKHADLKSTPVSTAYFCSAPLLEVEGNNWDQAPYERFAEPPRYAGYGSFLEVEFFSMHDAPEDKGGYFSVREINQANVGWLCNWGCEPRMKPLFVGASVKDFYDEMVRSGGIVYSASFVDGQVTSPADGRTTL